MFIVKVIMSSGSVFLLKDQNSYLDFSDCGVFDKYMIGAIDKINQNDSFKEINLYRNNLTDRLMPKLATLKHIEIINLCHNNITDKGVEIFIEELSKQNNQTKFKSLNFTRNNVTVKSIELLQKILPECKIEF